MSKKRGRSLSSKEIEAFKAKMREAREQCFAILFEMTFTDDSYEDILDAAVESRLIETTDYTIKVLDYFSKHRDEIDEKIKGNIKGWSFDRLSRVALSVLRLAISEMECGKAPVSVVINEAVELTKKFGAEREPKFVNAVLGSVVRAEKEKNADEV